MRTGPIKLCTSIAFVASTLAFTQASFAQSESPPTSRTEVKAQTRAANKSGELLKAGEAPLPEKTFQSTKTRIDRKAETIEARKRGDLPPPGEATYKAQLPAPIQSSKLRAERKAETLQAAKDGNLTPAGEAEDPAMVKTTPRQRQAKAN